MKQLWCMLIMLLWAVIAQGQTLLNQGFEQQDTSFPTGVLGWKSRLTYTTGADLKVRHSGTASMRLQSIPGKGYGTFFQLVSIPKSNNLRKFRISGYLKRDSVEEFAGIYINVYEGENTLFFNNMADKKLNGSSDWQEISTEFFVDEAANELQIGGLVVGSGRAWFDDLSLTEVHIDPGELPKNLNKYLSKAINIIQKKALNRDSVDWPKVRARAFLMASGAKTYQDCYPSIHFVLGKLKDHHSFLMNAEASKSWADPAPDAYKKMPLTTGEILDQKIAYLRMPSVNSGSEIENTYFADQLHNLLETLDQANPDGWILDLRGNSGGNCWPMLAGIGPVLGEGPCGYFLQAGGGKEAPWFYQNGKSGIGKSVITKLSRKPYKLRRSSVPVAVLTGPNTASSGEVVTVAFRSRPNTRSFGTPTAGLSTGNQNFRLADGAQIFLTSSVYADRNKVGYGVEITPDQVVTSQDKNKDEVLDAAKEWLRAFSK